jgi:clorobiocin biosynthesis protein CloN7
MAFTGLTMPPQGESAVSQPPSAQMVAAAERFFERGLFPVALYRPDIPALRATPARVVVGGGATSRAELAHRTAVALAERLGTRVVDFPGGHVGFLTDAADFAAVLRRTLVADTGQSISTTS